MPDQTKPQSTHAEERLRTETIVWLSTVRANGRPHIVPVWFLWDGSSVLIFSQPDKQKVRNLQHNQNVALALDSTNEGEDVVVLEGKAKLLSAEETTFPSAYVEKYGQHIKDMGQTPEAMAMSYSQAIQITPTKFISWGE